MLRKIAYVMAGAAALGIAACSGNLGTGSGLPAPPGYAVSPSAVAANVSREHTTAGVITLTKDETTLKFPASTGFGLEIDLGTPGPKATGGAPHAVKGLPTPSPSPSPSPSASPAGKGKPTPAPTPSGPKIDTKVTVFPQDAPAAPTPEPTGEVQSFAQRVPIVRGYMMSQTEIKLSSLAAIRFILPKDERPDGRGFSIALFEQHKHRKYGLVGWEPEATIDDGDVSAADATTPVTLKKKMGYVIVLYGDDLEPTPVPRGQYAPPGNNPFVTPQPSGMPGRPYFGPPTPVPPGYPPNGPPSFPPR